MSNDKVGNFMDEFIRSDLSDLTEIKSDKERKKTIADGITNARTNKKKGGIPLRESIVEREGVVGETKRTVKSDNESLVHKEVIEALEDAEPEKKESLYDDGLSEIERKIISWNPSMPNYRPGFINNTFNTDGWVGNIHLDKILTDAVIQGASDVHIVADQVISFTINGDIVRKYKYEIPNRETMLSLVYDSLLGQQDASILNTTLAFNGSYTLQHGPYAKEFTQRTRINISKSFGSFAITFRIINDMIPSLEDLGIGDEMTSWADYPNGLFLLCGPTGSGKTTTLASILRRVQKEKNKKIITIENPIEYIYPDDSESLVVQSEVGVDTLGFYEGLTSAMRQNPDIILLGEVRNTEEVQELLRAAETGHLSISTMHTNSVATTINRIQNLFTGNDQKRIMSTLADSLRGIGNQVLVKDKNDGRFAVRELLTVNQEIKDLILDGDVPGIRKYQIKHEQTMEHNLVKAVLSGKCLKSEAIKHTADPVLFNKIFNEKSV